MGAKELPTKMIYTIDAENNITALTNREYAGVADQIADTTELFRSQRELETAALSWPLMRLVEIWNSIAGNTPVKKFENRAKATRRIWEACQRLATEETPAAPTLADVAPPEATGDTDAMPKYECTLCHDTGKVDAGNGSTKPCRVCALGRSEKQRRKDLAKAAKSKKTAVVPIAKKAPPIKTAKVKPASVKSAAPKTAAAPARDGSKQAQVVAMLKRKNGATLPELMEKFGWQRHTVRGLIAGALKRAGFVVESYKPEGGERTYRIGS